MAEIEDAQINIASGVGACKSVAASYLHNEAIVGTTENNAQKESLCNETCTYYLTSGPLYKTIICLWNCMKGYYKDIYELPTQHTEPGGH